VRLARMSDARRWGRRATRLSPSQLQARPADKEDGNGATVGVAFG